MARLFMYILIFLILAYNSHVISSEKGIRNGELQEMSSGNLSDISQSNELLLLSKHDKEKHEKKSKGKKSKKVTLCHIPPGNPDNAHTISASESSVNTHLEHGDYLGSCEEISPPPQRYTGIIEVLKYYDNNRNGQKDVNEYGLDGWTITVYNERGVVVESRITGADSAFDNTGLVKFELPSGRYKICETLQSGWLNTDPGGSFPCRNVTLNDGEQERIYFGNMYESAPSVSDCTSIGEILTDVDYYKGRKTTVCGTVVDIITFPYTELGAFQLNDGTGLMWAIPYGFVPAKGDRVRVSGTIDIGVTIKNIPLGVLIRGFTTTY
jgi:hypothetical protein